ncbi:MAG TPA: carboxymuconolactone decarboxylase family protein [Mycobacterium sp.]|jgi:4-carboxymuconolactone decarboxylase|uniref:carboxymuconolactone decarboxylase family protein n=1 Tax=Mycobacterium sp. TaxID=1785 RepID=UPI002CDE9E6B|nr:carboxymuconolactone decarboxylase family protein [Mycobacterium sp.]HXO79272.1 carboxymuconolactone decarboxylase family protein [Mycobacterium sp.]
MPRIPLTSIEDQTEPVRQWMARRGNLNVFRLLANAPHVFPGWTRMVDELFASPTFSPRMREVVILRVAHLQGSPYELGQHVGIARTAGLTEQQIDAILENGDLDAVNFSRTERTALDITTELCTTHRLRDDTFAAAHAAFGDEALTELLMIISCYYGLALVLNAADLDVDATDRFQL